MGWLKDVFNPKGAEKEREEKLRLDKRKIYPVLFFDNEKWLRKSSTQKIQNCQELATKVEELRLLRSGKADDSAMSDGFRADTRGLKIYGEIYKEYKDIFDIQSCGLVISKVTLTKDDIRIQKDIDNLQSRIEADTEKQRTLIIAVGGVVLLLGTVLIIRKL